MRTAGALRLDVPDFFTPLDLGADPAPRVELLLARTPALDDAARAHLVHAQEAMIGKLRDGRVRYAATSLVLMGEPAVRPSIALFTVAVHPVHVGVEEVLDSVARALAAPHLRRGVGRVDLPVGRALAVVEELAVTTAATAAGVAVDRARTVAQAQLMLPFPDRRALAVLSMSTEFPGDFPTYAELLGAIAATVSFARPPEDRPSGGRRRDGPIAAALDR